MQKLLHIIATPREDESRTLQITEPFLEAFQQKHTDWVIDELNLAKEILPALTLKTSAGKYVLLSGKELFGELKESWEEIIMHIDRFKSADLYLLSTPMWNFNIPYMLKHYIDILVQPNYVFRYTDTGTEGLIKDKKMVVISSRGGNYVSDQTKGFDFQEPYLRTIFGFIGITDMSFVIAQPMDMGIEIQQQKIKEAIEVAKQLALKI